MAYGILHIPTSTYVLADCFIYTASNHEEWEKFTNKICDKETLNKRKYINFYLPCAFNIPYETMPNIFLCEDKMTLIEVMNNSSLLRDVTIDVYLDFDFVDRPTISMDEFEAVEINV